jgi:hypothetical protein
MKENADNTIDIPQPVPIRVETALPRYPIHRLAKHGEISIDIREKTGDGELTLKWEVNYIGKFGQPGPLAYKLDTLIINRRIEEAARPISRIIRLGSLHEICRELGITEGKNKHAIKNALYQNASAFITAKTSYRNSDGKLRTIEFGDTRYGVVFTGEKLPDGRTADAVYIVLHDFYMEILNHAMTRPLDYDYLKSLPPAPQRFYELLSYQMYAAIKNDRSRAKLLYSYFCTHAPQTRYASFDQVKKQMYKIHCSHRKSGYIAKVEYQQTADVEGKPDWIMLYQPGPKARAEFRAFTKRGGPVMLEVEPFTPEPPPSLAPLDGTLLPSPLECELIDHGVTAAVARQLATSFPEEAIRLQLEILDWLTEKKPEKITEPAAYLVSAIKNGHATPKGFVSRAERERRAEAKRAKEQQAAEDRRRKQQNDAQADADRKAADAYLKTLGPAERSQLEAKALAAASEETRASYQDAGMARYRDTLMLGMVRDYLGPILRTQQAAEA